MQDLLHLFKKRALLSNKELTRIPPISFPFKKKKKCRIQYFEFLPIFYMRIAWKKKQFSGIFRANRRKRKIWRSDHETQSVRNQWAEKHRRSIFPAKKKKITAVGHGRSSIDEGSDRRKIADKAIARAQTRCRVYEVRFGGSSRRCARKRRRGGGGVAASTCGSTALLYEGVVCRRRKRRRRRNGNAGSLSFARAKGVIERYEKSV